MRVRGGVGIARHMDGAGAGLENQTRAGLWCKVCIRAVPYHIIHDNTGINVYTIKKSHITILTI